MKSRNFALTAPAVGFPPVYSSFRGVRIVLAAQQPPSMLPRHGRKRGKCGRRRVA